jgi:hypothetical protein
MFEWLMEHAWKAIPATCTKQTETRLRAINSAIDVSQMLLDVTP